MKSKILACIAFILLPSLIHAVGPAEAGAAESRIEGAWELVSARWPNGNFPGDFTGSLLKIYSKHDFAFVGQTKSHSENRDRYGGGTFELAGNDYLESITYHCVSDLVGRTIHFNLVIQGDTMTLSGPVVAAGEKEPGFRLQEVYKRKR